MEPLLVIQHVASEDPGLFRELLRERGLPARTVAIFRGEPAPAGPAGHSALLVMGGPMNVDDASHLAHLREEMALIRAFGQAGRPVLGICLGAQLAAAALGARVYPATAPEVGFLPVRLTPAAQDDPLLAGFPPEPVVLQWHGQTFDLPEGATRLAGSAVCPNQAFRLDKVWGLQFHLEADDRLARCWAEEMPPEAGARVRTELPRHGTAANALGRGLFERFLRVAGV